MRPGTRLIPHRDQVQPLSAVVIDAHLAPWEWRLQDPEGPLLAMRSTATVIAAVFHVRIIMKSPARMVARAFGLLDIANQCVPCKVRQCP